jgi:hypothetical protein
VTTEPQAIRLALESTDAEERRQALHRIGSMSVEDAMPLLLRALGDEIWRVRKEASAVAQTFATEPLLIRTLVAALGTSQDVGLRNAAVEVLAASGRAATVEITRQMEALDADGRKLAVEILGRGGDPAAFPVLEARLADEEPNIRQAAAEMLVVLGERVPLGVPLRDALTRALDDPDPLVRMTALDGAAARASDAPDSRASCRRAQLQPCRDRAPRAERGTRPGRRARRRARGARSDRPWPSSRGRRRARTGRGRGAPRSYYGCGARRQRRAAGAPGRSAARRGDGPDPRRGGSRR